MTAAIYIRKSREDKDKPAHRLQVQREQLPAYAKAQGWQVAIYDDGHASAARGKVADLQQRARLEADIKAGKINTILCIELSRLSRDDTMQDYVAWLHLCGEYRVKLATPSRSLDPSQNSDWMLLLMEGGFSSVEMKVLKSRMKEGADQAFRAGKFMGGTPPPPYIYDHAAGRPVIDPAWLPKMQKLWKMAETTSAKQIAEKLDLPEIFVRRAVSDDRLLFYQAQRLDPDNCETINCDWEPVMDGDQASRIREGRRKRKSCVGERAKYGALLSNLELMYCGYCGKPVKTWHNSKIRLDGTRNNYYGCQTKSDKRKCERSRLVSQAILDEKVLTNLFNTLGNLANIQEYWSQQQDDNPDDNLKQLGKQERDQQLKKQRLITAISEGVIEFADAKNKISEINDNLEKLKKEQQTILKQISQAPEWESLMISPAEFHELHTDDQREFIKLAIEKITIYKTYATITYPFPRTAEGEKTAQINLPVKQ